MKIPVGILGATGSVGQQFVNLLKNHPWFEVKALAASERSAGKQYKDAVNWILNDPIPEQLSQVIVNDCTPDLPCKVVFSGLDASVAGEIETNFAQAGYMVISNSRNHRYDSDVPLLIPEVNPDHLGLLPQQQYSAGGIVTNPNCSVVGLALALKPLYDRFGIESLHVVTLQALSGAGYPGVSSLDILDNVVPFVAGEEQKIQTEPNKILGTISNGKIEPAQIKISAQCNRVAVKDGHLECVSVKLQKPATEPEIIEIWQNFRSVPQELELPMAPTNPIRYFTEANYPQPQRQRNLDKGMVVSIGRLQPCPVMDYKFVLLSHNTIRGAAGAAILNAELMLKKGYLAN